jgi:hypothetical protein
MTYAVEVLYQTNSLKVMKDKCYHFSKNIMTEYNIKN